MWRIEKPNFPSLRVNHRRWRIEKPNFRHFEWTTEGGESRSQTSVTSSEPPKVENREAKLPITSSEPPKVENREAKLPVTSSEPQKVENREAKLPVTSSEPPKVENREANNTTIIQFNNETITQTNHLSGYFLDWSRPAVFQTEPVRLFSRRILHYHSCHKNNLRSFVTPLLKGQLINSDKWPLTNDRIPIDQWPMTSDKIIPRLTFSL